MEQIIIRRFYRILQKRYQYTHNQTVIHQKVSTIRKILFLYTN